MSKHKEIYERYVGKYLDSYVCSVYQVVNVEDKELYMNFVIKPIRKEDQPEGIEILDRDGVATEVLTEYGVPVQFELSMSFYEEDFYFKEGE